MIRRRTMMKEEKMVEKEKTVLEIAQGIRREAEKIIRERKQKAEAEGKRYFTPFSVLQEADRYPARQTYVDITEQTLANWLACQDRLTAFLNTRFHGEHNSNYYPRCFWLDGCQFAHNERRVPLRHGEMVVPTIPTYNIHDQAIRELSSVECCQQYSFDNIPAGFITAPSILLDLYVHSYLSLGPRGGGFRQFFYGPSALGGAASPHPAYIEEIFTLWEDIRWLKADIKKLKANIWLAKKPTLIRAKKAEIKKIKADNWIFRRPQMWRWPRWRYMEIWEVKEEIKRLKREGRGNEKIAEIEEPKEYDVMCAERKYWSDYKDETRWMQRRWLYPRLLNKEKVKLKSIGDYKREIRQIKEDIKYMKKLRKERIKEQAKKSNEWLKKIREMRKEFLRIDKTPRMVELKKRWKKHRKWIVEATKKCPTHYEGYCQTGSRKEAPEIMKVLDTLYVPTKEEFEHDLLQRVKGDHAREYILPYRWINKWRTADIVRMLSNTKMYGLGKVGNPNLLEELIYRECSHSFHDFNSFFFRSVPMIKGIGEWKELPKKVRVALPFPMVYRPILNKYGYTVEKTSWLYGSFGRWECRPIHPSDAWTAIQNPLTLRIWKYLMYPFFRIITDGKIMGFTKAGGRYGPFVRRPFDRWYRPSSRLNRIILWFFINYAK